MARREKGPFSLLSNISSPLPLATGFGDPHMVTLDGTPFTFNGYGEYFILKVRGVDFTLQGRMEPLTADDGTVTRATVYTAFAAKESGSDTVQVRNNSSTQFLYETRIHCMIRAFHILVYFFAVLYKTTKGNHQIQILFGGSEHTTVNFPFSV